MESLFLTLKAQSETWGIGEEEISEIDIQVWLGLG